MTMSLVCTSTNTISKQEHMATPSLHDQPFIDTTNWFNGCFISNTLVEQSHQDTSLRDQATVWFKKIEKEFISALKKAKKKRLLKTKEKPRVLARYLISAWNGLQVSRRILSQKKDLEKIIELHLSVLH